MIIYIELYLFANLIIHFYTILIIRYTLFVPIKKSFFIGVFMDLLYSLSYVYQEEYFIIIKYIFPFLLTLATFKVDIYNFFKVTFLYYLINFLFGGVSLVLNLSTNFTLLILLFIFLLITIFILYYFNKKEYQKYYQLRFIYDNKKYKVKAFFDTGCNLMHKLLPVIVLNSKFQFKLPTKEKVEIDNGYSKYLKDCHYLYELYVDDRKISCYVIFLDIKYDAIVGYL